MSKKQYVGDSVYVDEDNFGSVILTTEDGVRTSNAIVLEPETLVNLIQWLKDNGYNLR